MTAVEFVVARWLDGSFAITGWGVYWLIVVSILFGVWRRSGD